MTNEELVEKIQTGIEVTENMYQLYEQNKGIIYKMAYRYSWGAPIEDLAQEGYFGLHKAAMKYDKNQDIRFSAYLTTTLARHLKRYIDSSGRMISIPLYKQQLIYKYNQATSSYLYRYKREPSKQEYAGLLGISLKQVEDLEKFMFSGEAERVTSLDKQLCNDEDANTLQDIIAVACEDLDEIVNRLAIEQMWQEIKCKLKPMEYDIIYLRYRLSMNWEAIGNRLGMSQWAVRNVEERANRKLKHIPVIKQMAADSGQNL